MAVVKRGSLRGYLVLAGAFVLGGATGAAVSYALAAQQLASTMEEGPTQRLERRRFRALVAELGLTAEQQARVDEILQRHRQKHRELMQQAFNECGSKLLEHRTLIDKEVRQVLTGEQAKRFDELLHHRPPPPFMGHPGRGHFGRGPHGAGSPGDGLMGPGALGSRRRGSGWLGSEESSSHGPPTE